MKKQVGSKTFDFIPTFLRYKPLLPGTIFFHSLFISYK